MKFGKQSDQSRAELLIRHKTTAYVLGRRVKMHRSEVTSGRFNTAEIRIGTNNA